MQDRVLLEAHAHTAEVSRCGELSAEEIIAELSKKQYGAVVITDHYLEGERETRENREHFLEGYRKAKAAGEALHITVLLGMEIRFKNKIEDYLVYGLEEEDVLSLPDDVCDLSIRKFHELSQEKGWLVYQAHPFRRKMLPADPSEIDGIEIFNGNPRHNSQNRLASSFAARHALRGIAGSDVHRKGDAGTTGIWVPRDALTPKGLVSWLTNTPHPRIQYQEPPVDGIRYLTEAIPGADMIGALYHDAGWTSYLDSMPQTMAGIENSLRMITAWDDGILVGMARAVGDEHTILYVQDILVSGTYQGRGIGRRLMQRLLRPYLHVRQIILLTDNVPLTRKFFASCGFEDVASLNCVSFIRLS